MQRRLWFLDQLTPRNTAYTVPIARRLQGPLDVAALERALGEIVRRHDALRASFPAVDGEPVQVIAPPSAAPLPIIDLRSVPDDRRQAAADEHVADEAARPFDLAHGPPMRASLLRLGDRDHLLLLTLHHIVFDGWSAGVFHRELDALYAAFAAGQPSPLPDLPIQYGDFVLWQLARMEGRALEAHLTYWREHLEGAPAVLELPTDRPRPPVQTGRGAHYPVRLPHALVTALTALGQRAESTLFMVLCTAFAILLARVSDQDDFLIGVPIANRTRAETLGLIGFFTNTVVVRADLTGNPSLLEALWRLRESALGAYAHQDAPFEKIIEALRPPRDPSRNLLFQVMFVLQNLPAFEGSSEVAILAPAPPRQMVICDLTLMLWESAGELAGGFTYDSDLFDAETIARMAQQYETLLEGMAAHPEWPIAALPLLTPAEREHILTRWSGNDGEVGHDRCIHHLFEEQAARTPGATAVEYEGERITYAELDRRANRLAHYLRARGVTSETPVGLYLDRSFEMIVGLLGILKAGGSYVPLDLATPEQRLAFMLADARPLMVLTQARLRGRLPASAPPSLALDADWPAVARQPETRPRSTATARHASYIIYTSGSSGQPKGVVVEHRSLMNYTLAARDAFALTPADRVLQFAALSFDAAAEEIYPTLASGATLVLRPSGLLDSLRRLIDRCRALRLTVLDLPTALWHELTWYLAHTDVALPETVRLVIIGGEALLLERLRQWRSVAPAQVRLLNTYGPTEATVAAMLCDLTEPRDTRDHARYSSIGRPIRNVQAYILDRHLRPLPAGVPGELYLGGACLARGYLNRPDLTAERFISHPFSAVPGARLYRTGDCVRALPDGQVEFIGRADDQVKIRGMRVEPGEVEAALTAHPSVREAAVLARQITGDGARLTAYVVPADDAAFSAADLRAFLSRRLPAPMVPREVVPLRELPRTAHGKVDRAMLPSPTHCASTPTDSAAHAEDAGLRKLLRIWEEVLGVQHVRPDDNFFDLGGHSLLAVRLFHRIEQEFGQHLSLVALMADGSASHLYQALQLETEVAPFSLVALQPRGSRMPVVFVPPPDGGILRYRALVRHLGTAQPVYAVEVRHDQVGELARRPVEAVAADYAAAIRGGGITGPLVVGGYSSGGVYALEVARQLRAMGHAVPLLVLFDTSFPGAVTPCRGIARAMARRAYQAQVILGKLGYHLAAARALPAPEKLALLAGWAARWRQRRGHGGPLQQDQAPPAWLIENAPILQAYTPRPFPGRILFFWGVRNPVGALGRADPRRRWRHVARSGVEIHRIQADHAGILGEDPHARRAARVLRGCLRETQRRISRAGPVR